MRLALPVIFIMNHEGSASKPQWFARAAAVLGSHLRHVEAHIDLRLGCPGLEHFALPVHETGRLVPGPHRSIELGGLLAV